MVESRSAQPRKGDSQWNTYYLLLFFSQAIKQQFKVVLFFSTAFFVECFRYVSFVDNNTANIYISIMTSIHSRIFKTMKNTGTIGFFAHTSICGFWPRIVYSHFLLVLDKFSYICKSEIFTHPLV